MGSFIVSHHRRGPPIGADMTLRFRQRFAFAIAAVAALAQPAWSQQSAPASPGAATPAAVTTLVILGVDHSSQLVSRAYHPGYLRAFFERVKPSALCVERSPDEFARGDYYEVSVQF